MPQVRKLAPEEVQEIQNKGKGQRKLAEEEYDRYLADYEAGDYGEALLDEGENRLTVRNRLKAAAKRRGVDINFRRTSGDLVRFQVLERSNGTSTGYADGDGQREAALPEPEPEPAAPPAPAKKKGGRPKKTV